SAMLGSRTTRLITHGKAAKALASATIVCSWLSATPPFGGRRKPEPRTSLPNVNAPRQLRPPEWFRLTVLASAMMRASLKFISRWKHRRATAPLNWGKNYRTCTEELDNEKEEMVATCHSGR